MATIKRAKPYNEFADTAEAAPNEDTGITLYTTRLVKETIKVKNDAENGLSLGELIDAMITEALDYNGQVMEVGFNITDKRWAEMRQDHEDQKRRGY